MASKLKFGCGIDPINQDYVLKDPTKKNKATVKKMVIADPGVFMQILFEPEKDIKKIEIDYALAIDNDIENYDAELKWIMDGGNNHLDVGQEFNFFVPFVDKDFIGGTDEVDFHITIKFDTITLSIEEPGPYKLKTEPGYELNPNHYMSKEGDTTAVQIYQNTHQAGFELSDPTFQEAGEGVSGKLSYTQGGADFDTSLEYKNNLTIRTHFKIEKGIPADGISQHVFYLPYPRLKQMNLDPKDFIVNIGNKSKYILQSGVNPTTDDVTLKLLATVSHNPVPCD
ncbi:MAG: hypothetical protein AAF927_10955 [Bacteroidota bacterium]